MDIIEQYIRELISEDAESRGAMSQQIGRDSRWDSSFSIVMDRYALTDLELYKKMIGNGRILKKAFAKYADRSFMNSLTTVHWTNSEFAINLLKSYKQGAAKDELSTRAYLRDGDVERGNDIGIVVKGHITLLANSMDDIITGSGEMYRTYGPRRTKTSGANKGVGKAFNPEQYAARKILVLDKEDWSPEQYELHDKLHLNNEALVDNWKITRVLVSPSKNDSNVTGWRMERFESAVKHLGIDVPVVGIK